MRCRLEFCLVFGCLLVGCQAEEGRERADRSAQASAEQLVRVADAPLWEEGEAWRVQPDPLLSIGDVEGDDPYLLPSVQGALRVQDGRILVLARGAERRIRVFDEEGRHMESWGGAGDGPGEFGLPPWGLHPTPEGGGILVPEAMAERVSRFGLDGRFQERTTLRYERQRQHWDRVRAESCCAFREVLPDGSWLVAYPDEAPIEGDGIRRGEQVLVRFSSDGEWLGEFARVRGRLWRPGTSSDPGPLMYVPLTAYLATAVVGGEVFVSSGIEYRVDVFDLEGTPLRTLRMDREPPAFDGEIREAFLQNVRRSLEQSRGEREVRRRLSSIETALPARIAAFSDLLADPEANLLLVSPAIPGADDRSRTAVVLDSRGRLLGDLTLPTGLRPLQVGHDWILGVTEDDMGVNRVVLHRVRKPR